MRSAHSALLVLLASVLLLSPVLAQMGGPGGGMGHSPRRMADREMEEMHAREWGNLSETARARGLERAEAARLFARFTYANGNATGRFVSFGLDPASGVLRDYRVGNATGANATAGGNATGATFFTSVTPMGFMGNGTPAVAGARLRLDGGNATFMAHNNPTGLFAYRGENVSVTFMTAPNATLMPESNRSVMVAVGATHGHVILTGNGTMAISGSNLTVTGTDPRGGVIFLAHPGNDAGVAVANLHAVRDAMGMGHVGGMLSVVRAEGAAVADAAFLGVGMRVRDAAPGRVNVTVTSADPAGRAVVIHLDSSLLNATQGASVNVTLDGRPLPRAANATQALTGAGGAGGSWHLTNGNATGGAQVIVHVPFFSDHDIGISAANATGGPVATTPIGTSPVATSPVTTSPVATSPVATPPVATSPVGGTGPAATTPAGETPTESGRGAPGPGLALVALALLGGALLLRRR